MSLFWNRDILAGNLLSWKYLDIFGYTLNQHEICWTFCVSKFASIGILIEVHQYGVLLDVWCKNFDLDLSEKMSKQIEVTDNRQGHYVPDPLSRRLMNKIRQKLKLEEEIHVTLRDMALYAVFVICILFMAHGHRTVRKSLMVQQFMENTFIDPRHPPIYSQGSGYSTDILELQNVSWKAEIYLKLLCEYVVNYLWIYRFWITKNHSIHVLCSVTNWAVGWACQIHVIIKDLKTILRR